MSDSYPFPIPTAPLTMEAYRDAAFRKAVVAQLHQGKAEGKSPEHVAQEIASERRAIAQAIVTPEFMDAASNALLDVQKHIAPNTRYQTLPAQAKEAMQQIMRRRATEATSFAQRVVQPSYYQPLVNEANADAPVVPSLHDVKMKEVLDDLLHADDATGAPQVIAHIDATAKGMMIEHDELAALFAPNGALHQPLVEVLSKQLPSAPEARIQALAADWLQERHAAAALTSDLAANDGAAYREAVRRSSEWHQQKHAAFPTTTVQTTGLQTYKTPKEIEKEKTADARANDIAYTINHALSCGMTDVVLQPVIAAAFGINVGCGDSSHNHSHDHGDHHDHAHHDHAPHTHSKPKLTLKSFAHEAGHYFKGEIIGDAAAVPLTIAVQRLFPDFMNGLRKLLEPVFGWAFRLGANHTAHGWAKQHGLDENAQEVVDRAEAIYQHEITHLPQAAVWNMFAYPIGAVAQKMGGHNRPWPEIFKSKLVGAVVSNGMLIGGRMMAPGAAQKWDQITGEHIFMPVSKTVGKVFGVDEKTMENAAKRQNDGANGQWQERIGESQQSAQRNL